MKTQSSFSQPEVRGDGAASAPLILASGKNSISSEYHNLLCDIEDMITSATSLTSDDFVKAKEALISRIHDAKVSVSEAGEAVADRVRKSAKATNGYVHENPWQSIGVGAALGLIVGVIVARRK